MTEIGQRRLGLLVAAIAMVALLLLLLAPQAHAGNSATWLVILPVFFIGLIASLDVLWRVSDLDAAQAPESAFRRSSFQRPPPFRFV